MPPQTDHAQPPKRRRYDNSAARQSSTSQPYYPNYPTNHQYPYRPPPPNHSNEHLSYPNNSHNLQNLPRASLYPHIASAPNPSSIPTSDRLASEHPAPDTFRNDSTQAQTAPSSSFNQQHPSQRHHSNDHGPPVAQPQSWLLQPSDIPVSSPSYASPPYNHNRQPSTSQQSHTYHQYPATDQYQDHTLAPLSMSTAAPSLGLPVNSFPQTFSTMEPPFRAHAQQNGGPVIPPAVVTRSAPTQPANNRSFIHSNPRASNPSIPAPTNDPSHTNSRGRRGPFQKTAPSTNRGRSSAPSNAPAPPSSSDGILSLRAIGPVKEALALFRDGSPIMVALERTIRQTSNPAPLNSSQRDRILDFKGFSVYSNPTYSWLCALSKNDLDILAWVFVVSKHGRKEEVAKRIIAALRAPLKHKSPALAKRPSIPARMGARSLPPNMSHTASTTTNTRTVPSRSNHTANSRGSMPSLVPAPSNSRASRPEFSPLLQTLQQNLCTWRQTNTTSMPAPCPPLPTPQQNRNKQMQLLCHELLQGYDFDVGENPFNTPLNRPLGVEQHFVFFNSMQLSRGNCDPVLKFFTPPPIDPKVRPIIKGGDVQIHIRCLIVDANKPKTEWRQAWPFPATCRVNGHNVTLNQAQRYTNGKLAGRDAATNITPCLRKYKSSGSSEKNRVTLKRQVSNATAATGQYVLFAQEVLVLSHKTMTKRVVESSEKYWVEHRKSLEVQGTISPISTKFEMAQQGVVQFLRDSDGLSVSCMKVSLRCPLALTRISIPVKGKRCHHVQCFDLDNFLEYARRSSKFECPVCNKATCDPSALVISPYIEHALDKFKDCDEVEIFQDGSMVKVERKHTGVASDDENEDDVKGKANGRLNKAHAPSRAPNMDVVDLTLDSDDDLNLPVPNPTRSPPNDNEGTSDGCIEGIKNDEIGKGDGINEGNVTPTREDPHALQPFGTDIQAIDQDVDFSFRADFGNWGDGTSQGADDPTHGSRQYQTSNQREGWACDVIAIDSD